MEPTTRSLSQQESRVILALNERGRREATRKEIIELLGGFPKAADHVIESLRRKGWLERPAGGNIWSFPRNRGRMLWATAIYWLSPAISPTLITSATARRPPTTG